LIAFSGCSTASGFWPNRVKVTTTPSRSAVSINGQPSGLAPLQTWFSPYRSHLIIAEKEGWVRTALLVLPADDGKPSRAFQWSADAPLSELIDFASDPVVLLLRAPDTGDSFSVLLKDVQMADSLKESGHLSVRQHRELIRALTDFFDSPGELAGR